MSLYRYLRRPIAAVVVLVIYHTELPWRHTMYRFAGMNHVNAVGAKFQ